MAKDLKTSVKLETKTAEARLKALTKAINRVQDAVDRTARQTNRLNQNISRVTTATNKVVRAQNDVTKAVEKTNSAHKKTSSLMSVLITKAKRLAGAYLGVLGAKAAITTSDTITRAENKLNYLNNGDTAATQQQLDKIYTSAQKVRTGYADMMNNVSKSITLASGAFGGNIDNAIRFQEIMAEAYTLGGASAAEQSSSMYQMIQGLGSGILQGDELRSVREGAPLAYKAIEEFAQGIYGAEENLKDLASQGKITSDIVVAAIMNAGEEMDKAFTQTEMTFDQAWTNIKNTATKAFEPVLQKMNDLLNSPVGQSIINGIGVALQVVANALLWVFGLIESIYNFVVTYWPIISKILTLIGIALGVYVAYQLGLMTASLIRMAWQAVVTGITMIIQFIAMGNALGYPIAMATMFGIAMNMWAWIALAVLAVIIIVLVIISDSFVDACGNIVGAIFTVGAFFKNVFFSMLNIAIGIGHGLVAIWENIKIAFVNAFLECKAKFWDFVESVYSGVLKVANLINKVLGVFGIEIDTSSLEAAVHQAKSNAEKNRSDKLEYQDVAAAYQQGASTYDTWQDGWAQNAFGKGYDIGAGAGQWVTDKISGITDKLTPSLPTTSLDITDIGGSYDPSSIDDTAANTGRMADSMELAEEDLEYLRDVANMEWKKEFTTATIQVDMSNYNSIAGDGDLDGIVTKLTSKLYEELDYVANGVYA